MASNIQFLNNMYFRGEYDSNNKWRNDTMYIVYKDTDTGEKKVKRMDEPTFTFYQSKKLLDKEKTFIALEKVNERKCKFRNLIDYMAELIGPSATQQVKSLKENKQFSKLNEIHHNINFFSSDMDIEDFWKAQFLETHKAEKLHLSKAYYDIEVDTINHVGFPDENIAPCPINAVTLVDADSKEVFTLLLDNPQNPKMVAFKKNIKQFKKRIHSMFDEIYPGLNYNIMIYDDELVLIKEFFRIMNELQPDFAGGWNTKFDILTFINRIKQLGGNVEEIICHPDFSRKKAYYVPDTRHSNADERGDHFVCASYTQYIDQYLLYCQVRKGQTKKDKYTLNFISQEELGDTKLDYSDVGTISTLPYDDYELFVLYNIKDVLLCYKLEDAIKDIDFTYNLSLITQTRFNKVFKKTISIKNLFSKFCKDTGTVLANNLNNSYDDSDVRVIIKDKRFIPLLEIQGPRYIPTKIDKNIFKKLVDMGYDIEKEDMTIEGELICSLKIFLIAGKSKDNQHLIFKLVQRLYERIFRK